MYFKIPLIWGLKNINLTKEYIQEEEIPTQFLGEEEMQQVSLLVSGFIV